MAGVARCFAWNLPQLLIDTNAVWVVGRLFGLEIKDSPHRNRRFKKSIARWLTKEPQMYNYTLLDSADQVCTGALTSAS